MTEQDNGLADRIRDRIAATKTNPHRAAKAAGVSVDFIRDILRGRTREPGAKQLYRLAVTLGTSVGYLIGEELARPDHGLPPCPVCGEADFLTLHHHYDETANHDGPDAAVGFQLADPAQPDRIAYAACDICCTIAPLTIWAGRRPTPAEREAYRAWALGDDAEGSQ